MVKIAFLILLYFTFPLVIIWMCRRWAFFKKLGSIVLAYGFGLILGSTGIIPHGTEQYHLARQGRPSIPRSEAEALLTAGAITTEDFDANSIAGVQDMLTSIVVPLAFPLLLFSLNVKRWLKYAKAGFISMILAMISVIIIIITGFYFFRDMIPDAWKVAGMLVGLYTGGTPNLASLKVALNVDPGAFLMTSTYDILMGAVTIIFFITIGPKVFRAILPPFKHRSDSMNTSDTSPETESFDDFSGMFRQGILLPLLKALGVSLLIFALSFGLSLLLPGISQTVVVILSITTMGIAASFIGWLNRIEKTFQLGMYFILIFSFAVASMTDVSAIFSIRFLGLLFYIVYAYFGSLALHLLLSKIFRVNADDYLITTTAFVFSPPFVPVVAGALKNKEIIITGITVGIIGYLIGNYLGIALGYFLKGF